MVEVRFAPRDEKTRPFKYFKTSPEIIRMAVMLYIRFPLSLRNVEDLLHERSVEISHETVRFWWRRVRTDVRGRDSETADRRDALEPLAMASR